MTSVPSGANASPLRGDWPYAHGATLRSGFTIQSAQDLATQLRLGALPIKGKAEPVAAWEVVTAREARTRLDGPPPRRAGSAVQRGSHGLNL